LIDYIFYGASGYEVDVIMGEFDPLSGLLGGLMLGLGAGGFMLLAGRISGISGILGTSFSARGKELGWRLAFIAGLVCGPLAVTLVTGAPVEVRIAATAPGLVLAGILVGFGTRLGRGCTSGHGICGIARLSPRSLVATAVFVAVGMAVVSIVHHVVGVPAWP
jgi:uncharacterized membrane protein YedE/YeeE